MMLTMIAAAAAATCQPGAADNKRIVESFYRQALVDKQPKAAFETWVAPSAAQWLAIAALGLGPTGIAFFLWDIGTKRGDLAMLGTLSYATPLLSTGLLLAFGRAQPHWTQAVAVALLLAGAWLSVRGGRGSAEDAPAQ